MKQKENTQFVETLGRILLISFAALGTPAMAEEDSNPVEAVAGAVGDVVGGVAGAVGSVIGSVFQGIEEVVVTAQKRSEDIQDVPISISAFSGDFMQESGVNTIQELGAYTPNLSLTQSSQVANNRIIIRGVGSV